MKMPSTIDMPNGTKPGTTAQRDSVQQKFDSTWPGSSFLSTVGIKLTWILGIILTSISIGHYLTPEDNIIIHNILQRLYYIPIVWAAYRYGVKGGLIVSVVSGAVYLPHVLFGWQSHPEYQLNQIIEISLFQVVGLSAGYIFEQEAHNQRTLQSYEKMALFGNLSRTIIRSLKGPLRAINGMLVALEPMERNDTALQSCTQIIRDEVTRIERVRSDLISLVERKRLRLKKQNLNEILFWFSSQVDTGLRLKGIKLKKQVQEMKIPVQLNKVALTGVLHQLVAALVERNRQVRQLTLFTGQSSAYSWIGASAGTITLDSKYLSELVELSSEFHHEYALVPVLNVMNNHFGDARFRFESDCLVEFILVFPKRLKLPWYLRDETMKRNSDAKGGHSESQ
ncbi:MAG: hypothetical protein P1R58_12250 [bacterium]|nr:hypothetical protein [bacterium]MDT8302354.1 hypothetical protein [Sedimentisphaerales bacterium]